MSTQPFNSQEEMRKAILMHGRQALISAIIIISILVLVILFA